MSSPITTGFINEKHGRTRAQKMTWTTANDRKLLLIGLGKEISPKEYAIIAGSFPEKPTPKSIQERLAKLRKEQILEVNKLAMTGPTTTIHPPDEDDDDSSYSFPPFMSDMTADDFEAVATLLRLGKATTAAAALAAFAGGASGTNSVAASPSKEDDEDEEEEQEVASPSPAKRQKNSGGRIGATPASVKGKAYAHRAKKEDEEDDNDEY